MLVLGLSYRIAKRVGDDDTGLRSSVWDSVLTNSPFRARMLVARKRLP